MNNAELNAAIATKRGWKWSKINYMGTRYKLVAPSFDFESANGDWTACSPPAEFGERELQWVPDFAGSVDESLRVIREKWPWSTVELVQSGEGHGGEAVIYDGEMVVAGHGLDGDTDARRLAEALLEALDEVLPVVQS